MFESLYQHHSDHLRAIDVLGKLKGTIIIMEYHLPTSASSESYLENMCQTFCVFKTTSCICHMRSRWCYPFFACIFQVLSTINGCFLISSFFLDLAKQDLSRSATSAELSSEVLGGCFYKRGRGLRVGGGHVSYLLTQRLVDVWTNKGCIPARETWTIKIPIVARTIMTIPFPRITIGVHVSCKFRVV